MSLELVRASSQYAYFDLGAQPSLPIILGFKVKFAAVNVNQAIVGIYAPSGAWNAFDVAASNDSTTVMLEVVASPSYDTSSKTGNSSGTWHTVIAEFRTSTDRQIYLNDAAGNLNASNIVPPGATRFLIGAKVDAGSLSNYADAKIAEVFQLSTAPSAGEKTAFHNGDRPWDIWSTTLVRYWPLKTDLVDTENSDTLTSSGSPSIVADHPTMNGYGTSVTPAAATLTFTTFAPTVLVRSFEDVLSDDDDNSYIQLNDGQDPSTFSVDLAEIGTPGPGDGTLTIRAARI
jgi:hypothetical protein